MDSERFKELLEELDGNSVKTLTEKNARYSLNGDTLHNFRSGAEIAGGTPAQACWGYLTKHLVALRDMVDRNDFSNREDFLEKCQDSINYIRFLWCIGNDVKETESEKETVRSNLDSYLRRKSCLEKLNIGDLVLIRFNVDRSIDGIICHIDYLNDTVTIINEDTNIYHTFNIQGIDELYLLKSYNNEEKEND